MSLAILTDVTKCIGCLECVAACKKENNLNMDVPREWQKMDGLSARNWTSVLHKPDNHNIRKQCRHCLEPACASACPVGALHTTPEGAVVYDNSKCLGCRYCMMACPYGIPRYDWDESVPYVRKCILCYDRIKEGKQPACTEACPTQATIFGKREDLIKVAHQRIKENPDLYINKVWGEHEIGGTSVLYISDIDLGFLSYQPELGTKALPRTTAPAMNAVPFAFVGMGAVMYGINWVIKRRMNNGQETGKEGNDGTDE
ncbi:MAG: 4Fe-4S dicluster domain-containing protein [candidate division Zixibacteria bacterium]|nr:4Fe-4S dicluster domain-containing protein [candidate division Zixibacteria bacterium]